jgi:hypothetical protein
MYTREQQDERERKWRESGKKGSAAEAFRSTLKRKIQTGRRELKEEEERRSRYNPWSWNKRNKYKLWIGTRLKARPISLGNPPLGRLS